MLRALAGEEEGEFLRDRRGRLSSTGSGSELFAEIVDGACDDCARCAAACGEARGDLGQTELCSFGVELLDVLVAAQQDQLVRPLIRARRLRLQIAAVLLECDVEVRAAESERAHSGA